MVFDLFPPRAGSFRIFPGVPLDLRLPMLATLDLVAELLKTH
jgi:hypothetical protein